MPSTRLINAWLLTVSVLLAGPAVAAQSVTEQGRVIDAVRSMYAAAASDDLVGFHAVTSPDFFALESGTRMSGEHLMTLVKSAHAAGMVYVWQVTEPEVRVDGQTAWITYVNRGSLQDSTGKRDLTWLESAVLHKDKDVWRVQFLHSTLVPTQEREREENVTQSGLVTVASGFSVAETISRLRAIVEAAGFTVFARIDHAANAAPIGMELRPTQVLSFGNPKGGTLLMQDKQTTGLDLPLRVLAWEDADGHVRINYDDPAWIAKRHELGHRSDASVTAMAAGLAALVSKAAVAH